MRSHSRNLAMAAAALAIVMTIAPPAGAQFRSRAGMTPPAFSRPPVVQPMPFYSSPFAFPRAFPNAPTSLTYAYPSLYPSNSLSGLYAYPGLYSPAYSNPYSFSPYASGYYSPFSSYSSPFSSYSSPYPSGYSSPYSSGYTPSSSGYSGPYSSGYTPSSSGYSPYPENAGNKAEEANTVRIYDDYFKPERVTVTAGTTVRWTNSGSHRHTVTSDTGLWESGELDAGGTYGRTFTETGTYPYHCALHPQMKGEVVVK